MDLCGALVLTAWALLWFFVCMFVSGFLFVAVAVLIVIETVGRFIGRKIWSLK